MTSRALILPTPGDPCMISLWFKMFERWENEIDRLYMVVNTPSQEAHDIIKQIVKTYEHKVTLIQFDRQIEHGQAINEALNEMQEEYIGLIEDDTYVFKAGAIDRQFKSLESGEFDVVGSKRGSCSQEILDRAQEIWGLSYKGYGDQGCNFWPSLFFCKTELLKKTNREFGAKCWLEGETIKELDNYIVKDVCASDTFVWTSLQIRNLVPQELIAYIPQHHAGPIDLDDHKFGRGLFDGFVQWVHVGSLSSGFHGTLRYDNKPLAYFNLYGDWGDRQGKPNTDVEKKEWERRVVWWMIACTEFDIKTHGVNFWNRYNFALQELISDFKLDRERIRIMGEIYSNLLRA